MIRTAILLVAGMATLHAQIPVDRAWKNLIDGAASDKADMRGKATIALGLIPQDPKSRELAEKALADTNADVRTAAASALGHMGATASIPKLKETLKDHEAQVVLAAASALLAMGDSTAYMVYYAVLTGERKTGESLAETQMKMLKDPKAMAGMGLEAGLGFIPFAGAGLKVFKTVTKDDTSPVRAAAAQRLAKDPDPKSGEALSKTASDGKWLVRAAVADAIAKRDDPALLPAVVGLLSDENDSVRFNASAAVIRLTKKQE